MLLKIVLVFFAINCANAEYTPYQADWSESALIPSGTDRANIFNLDAKTLQTMKEAGYRHAMNYPVTVTGLLIPYDPLINFFKANSNNPLKKLILQIEKKYTGFKSEEELYEWLGLNKFNSEDATGIYKIPYPNGRRDQFYLGAGIVHLPDGTRGLTFSCFTCHSANLFGSTVLGLTNKRVRANKFFHMAKGVIPLVPNALFKISTGASAHEVALFDRVKKNLGSVGALSPQVLGLDTSLPQVALSLSRRNVDEYATKSAIYQRFPRPNELETFVADSKPMPWWNLKYKTRWLADGSIVSGNPIFTNFLWNELGRGTDLKALQEWMQDNRKTIDEVTVAAFATQAPLYTDFFPVTSIDLHRAKRGEKIFKYRCESCHGEYQKAWNSPEADKLNTVDILKTTKIYYHDQTPTEDVQTDPQRRIGVRAFADALNDLAISKWMQTKIELQDGYVPPPLVGIWSRYPYLHNNSIPNLCALLTKPSARPKTFIQGPAINKETDFDQECVGYPVGNKIPRSWLSDTEAKFDTAKPGLSNAGHAKMILGKKGEELLTSEDKKDLIHFLKTL